MSCRTVGENGCIDFCNIVGGYILVYIVNDYDFILGVRRSYKLQVQEEVVLFQFLQVSHGEPR